MNSSAPVPTRWKTAAGVFLVGWFLFFSRGVLGVQFSPDDMMNIDNFYWLPGPWRLLYSQLLLWRGYYLSRLPGAYRKARVVLDWSLAVPFREDIASIE